mgnify:CR=1 FL=1
MLCLCVGKRIDPARPVLSSPISRFTELHVIGVGTTENEIRQLVDEGKNWIAHYGGQQTISFPDDECEKLRR